MVAFLAPGTQVTVFCPLRRTRLRRVVVEHLTVGPYAGWATLQKPDGSLEHRTVDTLTPVSGPGGRGLPEHVEFYHRDGGRVLERHPIEGLAGQLTWARAEVSRASGVPEYRIGVRLAA